jgi:hypothetical protein
MVCHICLTENVNKKIDRLDLCNDCFIKVEIETAKYNEEIKVGTIKSD